MFYALKRPLNLRILGGLLREKKIHTDVVGINLSFALFQGQQRERDKLHDKYVRLVFYCAYRESR